MGAKSFRADIRTERWTDGRRDMAKLITSFTILQKRPKIFSKIISRTNVFVHYIKYRPNYDYGPHCKPFLLKWVLQKSEDRQIVLTLNARTVIRRTLWHYALTYRHVWQTNKQQQYFGVQVSKNVLGKRIPAFSKLPQKKVCIYIYIYIFVVYFIHARVRM